MVLGACWACPAPGEPSTPRSCALFGLYVLLLYALLLYGLYVLLLYVYPKTNYGRGQGREGTHSLAVQAQVAAGVRGMLGMPGAGGDGKKRKVRLPTPN